MSEIQYKDYWFNYVLNANPPQIKNIIKEVYIISEGNKIHLDIYNDESKNLNKTILFIHGTSVYSRFYAEFLYNLFQKGYRIVAPDLIGHGKSEGKRGHFTMEMFTQVIYDVTTFIINKYGDNVSVMGSSLGGITSLYCAANDQRLKAAVCHNAAIFNEDAYKKIIKIKAILKLLVPLVPFFAKITPKLRLSVYLYLDFEELAQTDKFLERIDLLLEDEILSDKYSLSAIKTQMRAPLAKPIEEIDIPIMIIVGSEDNLFSVEYMEEIYERLTHKERALEVLEGASHLIFQEHIEESLKRIIPWLEKVI
ncbi:MAG: alpha/beta fold hydrolase [Candidatus Lokiarchaeota archaeon]|nr:alpha/beta fold hydrolase [Candidatus Lokiarchaeota archaeon]MBD3337741.1 alpha/beta fold hydrolase [Candidatus Lokiarchaeota archaeon]